LKKRFPRVIAQGRINEGDAQIFGRKGAPRKVKNA
jgi:hypothetical protein